MPDLLRDLRRLEMMEEGPALEAFSLPSRINDFFRYYFSRFVSNLTHAFKPFSTSEIAQWNQRHRLNASALHYQLEKRGDKLVPIPLGMIHPYRKTLIIIVDLLKVISFSTLKNDVETLRSALKSGRVDNLSFHPFDQKQFDLERNRLGNLFTQMGLTHRPAKDVLVSATETNITNSELQHITYQVYQDIITIHQILPSLETYQKAHTWSPEHHNAIKKHCMSLGYRLTLYAILADHLQKLEHQFVNSLNIVTGV